MTTIRQLIIMFTLLSGPAYAEADFQVLADGFIEDYRALGLPELQLSYVDNLRAIKSPGELAKQRAMFSRYQARMADISPSGLTVCSRIHAEILNYEIALNLRRIVLEERFIVENAGADIPGDGLASVPMGKELYIYFLKRWLTIDWTPEDIFAFGEQEIVDAVAQYQAIQQDMGYAGRDEAFQDDLQSNRFFGTDASAILQIYREKQSLVQAGLDNMFRDYAIKPAKIVQSDQGANIPAPGFYNNNTFFFNIFKPRYNKRQIDWLYIHEAEPGHHFQVSHENKIALCREDRPPFTYGVFREGWGAYVEELGADIGLYQTPGDLLGKVEWDMIRSVRVPMDVGLNYYGWSDGEALTYWKKYIVGQDDIGRREINRMKNWPVQVLTYKVGAAAILNLRAEAMAAEAGDFDIREFHDRILRYGSLPLEILPSVIQE